jgi:hypothetical protein
MAMDIFFLTQILSFFYHGQDFCRTIWANRRVSYAKHKLLTLRANTWVHSGFLGSALLILLVFCVVFFGVFFSVLCLVPNVSYVCLWIVRSWLSLRFSLTFIYMSCFPLCHIFLHVMLSLMSCFPLCYVFLYVMFSFMSYFPSCYAFPYVMVPSWSWSYDNYLCNQCLSPLKLWVRSPFMARCTR